MIYLNKRKLMNLFKFIRGILLKERSSVLSGAKFINLVKPDKLLI
jgi:hypothetical protein